MVSGEGVGKRMNVSLETLKDVPRPKWTHFGSRRSFETANKVREILTSEGYTPVSADPAQIDAALDQITDKEAVRSRIREILNSPVYRLLGGEPQNILAEKLIMEKFMTEEESVQMEALKEALAEADKVKEMPVEVGEPTFEVKPGDEVLANMPDEAISIPTEALDEAKATGEAATDVEATLSQIQNEDEILTQAPEEAAPEAPAPTVEAQGVSVDTSEVPGATTEQSHIEVNPIANASEEAPITTGEAPVEEVALKGFEAASQQVKPEENVQVESLNETAKAAPEFAAGVTEPMDMPVVEEIAMKGEVEIKTVEIGEEVKEIADEEGNDEKK